MGDKKRLYITKINRITFDSIIRSTKSLKGIKKSEELLEIFKNHNLLITDESRFKTMISNTGYYHISGYRRVFLDSFESNSWSGKYVTGVTDDNLAELIYCDNELGKILLNYANKIERKLKSRSAYFLSQLLNEDFHLKSSNFKNLSYWKESFSSTYIRVLSTGEEEENPVILHHERNYDSKLPIWVFFEHISFGDYIKFMKNLSLDIQSKTFDDIFHSKNSQYPIRDYMSAAAILDFLYIVKMVRNRISHLGRIYDWTFHYNIGSKSFTEEFNYLFDPTKNDYTFRDIIDVFGFFLNKSEYELMMKDITEVIVRIETFIPSPYSDRIINFMGYLII